MSSLGFAHRGYQYQDLYTAYYFALSILKPIDSITVDRKLYDGDRFDDFTYKLDSKIYRRQIKSSKDEETNLEERHFSTVFRKLEIDALVKSVKEAGINTANEYRLCATWKEPVDSLKDLLIPVKAEQTFEGYNTKCFRLDTKKIWAKGQLAIWNRLNNAKSLSRSDFIYFANRFVIELNLPSISSDLRSPGELELLLLNLLTESIGFGRYPNHRRDPVDVAEQLIKLATVARTESKEVTRNDIESAIQLQKDFGRVAQEFPVEKSIVVTLSELQKNLYLSTQSSRVIFTGEPGAGKSWALTELAASLESENILTARHYCYLEPGDQQVQRRITTEALFGNLIYELIESKPELKDLHKPIYSSGPRELEQLLEKAFAKGFIDKCVLIVDGVDHISRVFSEGKSLTKQDVDIVEELALLKLPAGVCLIIGSQPGEHLDPLRSENILEISVPTWNKEQIFSLIKKTHLLRQLKTFGLSIDEVERFIEKLYIRSEGNPLYATFLCKQSLFQIQSGEIINPLKFLDETPQINGQISNYYQYLFDSLENDSFGEIIAKLLGLLDFGITETEIKEIYPIPQKNITKALAFLMPILVQTSAQGGIRIYHESFRRFVSEQVKRTGESIPEILKPVINWLSQRDFFYDAKAYRFLLPCLRRAERTQELLQIIGAEFVSTSLFYGHPQRAIEENIKLATYVAAENLDWGALVKCAELRRSIIICFQEKIEDVTLFGQTFAAIFSPSLLNERLLFDGKPTLPPQVGLLLCSLCDDAEVSPPWDAYLDLEEPITQNSYKEYEANRSDDIDLATEIARLHGAIKTEGVETFLPNLISFIEESPLPTTKLFRASLSKLAQFGGIEVLKKIFVELNLTDYYNGIVLIELSKLQSANGQKTFAKKAATQAIKLNNSIQILFEALLLGANKKEIIKSLSNPSNINIGIGTGNIYDDNYFPEDWINAVRIAAEVKPNLLKYERNRIVGNNWYELWLRFVIDLSEAEVIAKADSNKAEILICEALKTLSSDTRPFAGKPRACDLYRIHPIIHKTIARGLALLNNTSVWSESLGYLNEISYGTLTSLQGALNGPLSPESLIKLLLPFAINKNLSDLIVNTIRQIVEKAKRSSQYYETQAEQEMLLAYSLAKTGNRHEALEIWKSISIKLCAYGFRKDTTIYELIESVASLKKVDGKDTRAAAAALQPLVNAVVQHTDGKETKSTPVFWFSSLCEIDLVGASRVLADSLVRNGGAIDWRYEDALKEFIDFAIDFGNPQLVNSLASTQPYKNGYEGGIKSVQQRLLLIKKIIENDLHAGRKALNNLAAQVHGDAEEFNPEVYEAVKRFADINNIEITSARLNIGKLTRSEESSKYSDNKIPFLKESTIFPVNADFSQLIFTLRDKRFGRFNEHKIDDQFINALGFRILEMLEAKDGQRAIQLLQYFSRITYFEFKEASPLADIGEGLKRYGYIEEAAIAFSLAYARSRGGGGWLALGDAEQLIWLDHSLSLSNETAEKTLANELVYWLNDQHHILGITRHLIEFSAEHKPQIAFDVWNSAFSVIKHRLPDSDKDYSTFKKYDPEINVVNTIDEAVVMLLLARVSHPEFRRKKAALAGVADAISSFPETVISPLRYFFTVNTPFSSILLVLLALVEAENHPFKITRTLQEELKIFLDSDVFGLQILSQILLERIGVSSERKSFDFSNLPKTAHLDSQRLEILISGDWGERALKISEIWNEFPTSVAQRFDYIFSTSRSGKDIKRIQNEAAFSRTHENLPRTPMLFWANEEFELAFHETLARIEKTIDEELSPIEIDGISSIVFPKLHLHIANFHSRVPRPNFPIPSQQISENKELHPLNSLDKYNGWYRCGYFERELMMDNMGPFGNFLGIKTVMEGIEFHTTLPSSAPYIPFAGTDGNLWWENDSSIIDMTSFSGSIIGLDMINDLLGFLPILVLHPSIASTFKIKCNSSWQDPLALYDNNNEIVVLFRSWQERVVGDGIAEENIRLEGCDLIVRPDIFESLVQQTGKPYQKYKSQF